MPNAGTLEDKTQGAKNKDRSSTPHGEREEEILEGAEKKGGKPARFAGGRLFMGSIVGHARPGGCGGTRSAGRRVTDGTHAQSAANIYRV